MAKVSSDKVLGLTKHLEGLKNRLSSKQVGAKHKNRPEAYFEWLKTEIDRTSKKLESLKLA